MVAKRQQRFLSGNTVFAQVTPFNEKDNKNQMNFAVDYKEQQDVVPNGFVTGLGGGNTKTRAMNKTGRAALALLSEGIGSDSEEKGNF